MPDSRRRSMFSQTSRSQRATARVPAADRRCRPRDPKQAHRFDFDVVESRVGRIVVETATSDGRIGVEPNPNRTAGSTSAIAPRSLPSQFASTASTRRRSVAPYVSLAPTVRPLVRTPRIVRRTTGSSIRAHVTLVANRRGTQRSAHPEGVTSADHHVRIQGGALEEQPTSRPTRDHLTDPDLVEVVDAADQIGDDRGRGDQATAAVRCSTIASANAPNGEEVHRPMTTRTPAAVPKPQISPSKRCTSRQSIGRDRCHAGSLGSGTSSASSSSDVGARGVGIDLRLGVRVVAWRARPVRPRDSPSRPTAAALAALSNRRRGCPSSPPAPAWARTSPSLRLCTPTPRHRSGTSQGSVLRCRWPERGSCTWSGDEARPFPTALESNSTTRSSDVTQRRRRPPATPSP